MKGRKDERFDKRVSWCHVMNLWSSGAAEARAWMTTSWQMVCHSQVVVLSSKLFPSHTSNYDFNTDAELLRVCRTLFSCWSSAFYQPQGRGLVSLSIRF